MYGRSGRGHNCASREIYISDISVHERYQGMGVGKSMLEWMLQEATLRPESRYVSLHVAESNVGAKQLYTKMGFQTLETKSSKLIAALLGEQTWSYMVYEGLDYLRERKGTKHEKETRNSTIYRSAAVRRHGGIHFFSK